MTTSPESAVWSQVDTGTRIALLRRQRGLTQHGLATKAGVSYSLLSKVETAAKPPSSVLISACARALGVDEPVLTGRYHTGERDRLATQMPPIRAALDVLDLAPDTTVQPRPIPELAAAVRQLNTHAQAARYAPVAATLPGLLAELHTAAHQAAPPQQPRLWALLAAAVRCAHSAGIALGMTDLSVAALHHMDTAAYHAGDQAPGLRAARNYLRVTVHLRAGDYAACRRINTAGIAHLDGTDPETPGALLARGQLHLGAAVIAAHTAETDPMHQHLDAAERIAAATGEQPEQFWFGFGPTNVAVHRVMTWGLVGEHARAVAAAESIHFPPGWLPTRVGHHYLDLAHAYRWLGQPDNALAALHTARHVAPGQARRHPRARETVTALLRTTRRSSALTDYATWLEA